MIAVDTNVVIRLLTGDDPAQYERAHRLFATETIFLPKTVLLESEWVLRSLYSLAPERIVHAITALVALPQVRCEDAAVVSKALEWLHTGLDFADALHLASSTWRSASPRSIVHGCVGPRSRRAALLLERPETGSGGDCQSP